MPGVTLDTNVYVSALHFGGKPMALLQAGLDGEVDIAISQPIVDETLRILRDKFAWTPDDLRDAERVITAATRRVTPTRTLDVIKEDEPDNRILECADAAGSDFIISGDKDLLRMNQFGSARILKIADFLGRAL